MPRKKVEVRKQRDKPFPLQLCVMISPEIREKIDTYAKANGISQSVAARVMLLCAQPNSMPRYTQLEIE
jgi:hypothetical protein